MLQLRSMSTLNAVPLLKLSEFQSTIAVGASCLKLTLLAVAFSTSVPLTMFLMLKPAGKVVSAKILSTCTSPTNVNNSQTCLPSVLARFPLLLLRPRTASDTGTKAHKTLL